MLQGKVLQQDQPLRMVQRALVDRQPAEAMFAEGLDQLVLADVQRYGNDFGLGDRHVVDPHPPQRVQALRNGCHAGRGLGGGGIGRRAEGGKKSAQKATMALVQGGIIGLGQRALRCRRPVGATAHRSFVQKTPVWRVRV